MLLKDVGPVYSTGTWVGLYLEPVGGLNVEHLVLVLMLKLLGDPSRPTKDIDALVIGVIPKGGR